MELSPELSLLSRVSDHIPGPRGSRPAAEAAVVLWLWRQVHAAVR